MKNTTESEYRERLARALAHIEQNLDGELELDALAGVACFSPFHFHRVFRALVGEPVHEHVRRLRLERAALRLKREDRPVTAIALEAGYESHEAFTRAFHAMFGASPSQYRAEAFRPPDYGTPPPVEIRALPPQRILYLRHTGPYAEVSGTWNRLAAFAGPRGLIGPATRFIGLSYDDPDVTAPEKLRYDAAITVGPHVQPEAGFGISDLAGGDYAALTHCGPYDTLSRAYQQLLGAWLPKSGRELRDAPGYELYLNSPRTARPGDLLTVIHIPLA